MSTTAITSPLRRRAALAIAGLTVATLGATVIEAEVAAAAGKAKVNASISLTKDKSKLVGKVKSPRKVCRQKTQVVLHWQEPGKKKFRVVADDKSNKQGVWKIDAPGTDIPRGKYYVTIAANKQCKSERSKTIRVN